MLMKIDRRSTYIQNSKIRNSKLLVRYFRGESIVRRPRSFRHVLEPRAVLEKGQLQAAGGAVALFGDDDLGDAFQFGRHFVAQVVLFAKDERDYISVLLDRPRFAQVGKLRTLFSLAATFGRATQLRERDYRNTQLLGQRLESARHRRDLLRAVFVTLAAAATHELQVIDNDQVQLSMLLHQATGFGAHLRQRDSWSIVDEDWSFRQRRKRGNQLLAIVAT